MKNKKYFKNSESFKLIEDSSWWVRFRLLFQKRRTFTTGVFETTLIEYKTLKNMIYITAIIQLPPNHINCRCTKNEFMELFTQNPIPKDL